MLQNLHVKNLALIDEVEVDFGPGLNILTGETGAGKSIILGSVNLALGGRYNADMLRKGARFGLVELMFSIENQELIRQLEEMDIFPEDGMLILSRKLMEGRSVSKINGETVTMGVLRDVASLLIDIHEQHEHQRLLNKRNHLTLLSDDMQFFCHLSGCNSTDPGVDLIKNQCWRVFFICQHSLDRQKDSGEFTS